MCGILAIRLSNFKLKVMACSQEVVKINCKCHDTVVPLLRDHPVIPANSGLSQRGGLSSGGVCMENSHSGLMVSQKRDWYPLW